MQRPSQTDTDLVEDLRAAIAADRIEVWFQPKVDARSRRCTSLEALARWRRDDGQFVPPDVFIALAESAGLIDELGMQVLRKACRAVKPWLARGLVEHVAVNVSPKQLAKDEIVPTIAGLLAAEAFDPAALQIEITESLLVEPIDAAARRLNALHSLGLTIALDDFGTGCSNLAALKSLPLDVIKIDRVFVTGLAADADDRLLVRSTVDLAHGLGLTTVGEGVENEDQAEQLRLLGCDELQGFLFAQAMPADECEAWLLARANETNGVAL